jgi:hypothetical protein
MFGPPLFVPESVNNTPLSFSASLNGGADLDWKLARLADKFSHSTAAIHAREIWLRSQVVIIRVAATPGLLAQQPSPV